MICRFCNVDNSSFPKAGKLVKYAARHWAHHHCWLSTKGRELSDPSDSKQVVALLAASFHGWQLRQFPVFVVAEWLERKGTRAPGQSWVNKAMGILRRAIDQSEAPRVESREEKAVRLLKRVASFWAGGNECDVCGSALNQEHENDCFVPEIEKLTGVKVCNPKVEVAR